MYESREEMIGRLKEEIGRLLDERLPLKGSTIDEIERITEELGREIERKIEEGVTRQEGRGYVGSFAPCECGNRAVYKKDYANPTSPVPTSKPRVVGGFGVCLGSV